MDINHNFVKKLNFFCLRKCLYCEKTKIFKKIYKCTDCHKICHRKCFKNFLQERQTNKPEVLELTETTTDTTDVHDLEQDVKVINENSVTLIENKNISLPASGNVQHIPEFDLNTNNLENVMDEKELDETFLETDNSMPEQNLG